MMSVPGHSPPKIRYVSALADERDGEDDGVGDPQPGARQQVVGQRVAGEAGGEGEDQQQHADDPVDLARPAERAGEEHAGHVQGDRADEHERRPVVHLADQQPALDVEGDAHHRVVGRRHLDAPQRLVRARRRRAPAASPRRRTSGRCPVISRTTKLYRATSPHRNEKWLGNTLCSTLPTNEPPPTRPVTEST